MSQLFRTLLYFGFRKTAGNSLSACFEWAGAVSTRVQRPAGELFVQSEDFWGSHYYIQESVYPSTPISYHKHMAGVLWGTSRS